MRTVNLIPLAGNSKRFLDKGYLIPKQFIHINGIPMFIQAALSLPKGLSPARLAENPMLTLPTLLTAPFSCTYV